MRIALACQKRGHAIRVYTLEWRGEVPAGFEVLIVPVRAMTNARRYAKFTTWMQCDMQARPVDRVVGFNKMPGLDVYFAADPCYEDKAQTLRNPLYWLSGRYRHFAAYERAVFAPDSRTEILMISQLQQPLFEKHYATPAASLPPAATRHLAGSAGASQRQGNPCRLPRRVRPRRRRFPPRTDWIRLQDQGAGSLTCRLRGSA